MSKKNKKVAQVTLELAIGFVCVAILVLASVKIAVWLVNRMAVRQEDYETSANYGRVTAGSTNIGVEVDESDTTKYKKLDIFK